MMAQSPDFLSQENIYEVWSSRCSRHEERCHNALCTDHVPCSCNPDQSPPSIRPRAALTC